MKNLFLLFSTALVLSCNDSGQAGKDTSLDTDSSTQANSTHSPGMADASGCFMGVVARDTMVAHLQKTGNLVTGKLSFDNYQKDGSTGSVEGVQEGDIIKLTYSFASEGTNSVMDVYFKVKENNLVRGIGEMQTRGDTAYFVNPSAIQYKGSELTRMDCEKVPGKYKG